MDRLLNRERLATESLEMLCNDALVLSKDNYTEFSLGGIVITFASASWRTSSGGLALLNHKSLSLGGHVRNKRPTSLQLFEHPADRVVKLTRFSFNTKQPDSLQVYNHCLPMHDVIVNGHINHKHIKDLQVEWHDNHLDEPTPADTERLYYELGRGASGLHTADSAALAEL